MRTPNRPRFELRSGAPLVPVQCAECSHGSR
jgi:hypothetical protein